MSDLYSDSNFYGPTPIVSLTSSVHDERLSVLKKQCVWTSDNFRPGYLYISTTEQNLLFCMMIRPEASSHAIKKPPP